MVIQKHGFHPLKDTYKMHKNKIREKIFNVCVIYKINILIIKNEVRRWAYSLLKKKEKKKLLF